MTVFEIEPSDKTRIFPPQGDKIRKRSIRIKPDEYPKCVRQFMLEAPFSTVGLMEISGGAWILNSRRDVERSNNLGIYIVNLDQTFNLQEFYDVTPAGYVFHTSPRGEVTPPRPRVLGMHVDITSPTKRQLIPVLRNAPVYLGASVDLVPIEEGSPTKTPVLSYYSIEPMTEGYLKHANKAEDLRERLSSPKFN